MSSEDKKKAQLLAFIEKLPERDLRKLAASVELDRMEHKLGLPHNAIMAILRPGLALIRAPRVLTAQRAFFLPAEDMLVNGKPSPKPVGKIDRSTLQPIWVFLTKTLKPKGFQELCDNYTQAQLQSDDQAIAALSLEMWAAGASALTAAFAAIEDDEKALNVLADKLGGPDRLADAREIASTLRIAAPLEALKSRLAPKPMMDLSATQVAAAKEAFRQIYDDHPEDALTLMLALMGRLLRPFPIVKVIGVVSRSGDDSLVQRTEMDLIGKIVLDDLETDADAVEGAVSRGDMGDMEVVQRARYFSQGFNQITTGMGITREGKWGQRLFAMRARVADALQERIIKRAEKTIAAALPTRKGSSTPHLATEPDIDNFERAEDCARAIGELNRIGERLGLQSASKTIVGTLRKNLENYSDAILKLLPDAPADKIAIAQSYLCIAVRLVELLTDSEAAETLRRRGMNALSTAIDRS